MPVMFAVMFVVPPAALRTPVAKPLLLLMVATAGIAGSEGHTVRRRYSGGAVGVIQSGDELCGCERENAGGALGMRPRSISLPQHSAHRLER